MARSGTVRSITLRRRRLVQVETGNASNVPHIAGDKGEITIHRRRAWTPTEGRPLEGVAPLADSPARLSAARSPCHG
jgi:hypothetical protein